MKRKLLGVLAVITLTLALPAVMIACGKIEGKPTYTVTFESNGGSVVEAVTVEAGGSVNLQEPERDGYTFVGWFVSADLTGSSLISPYTPSGSITLYAKWEEVPEQIHKLTHRVAKDATCVAEGNSQYWECSVCKNWFSDNMGENLIADKDSVIIPATGHSFSDVWRGDDVRHWHECRKCGEKDGFEEHIWGSGEITAAAGCTADGLVTYSCSECGYSKIENLPATGHNFSEVWRCDETWHWQDCLNCGERVLSEEHDWDYGEIIAAADCTTDGVKKFNCRVCNTTKIENVPAMGHSFSGIWSCDDVSHWQECLNCGERTFETNHNWNIKVTAAGCTTDGVRYYHCPECNETKSENIPATGHSFSEVWSSDESSHWQECVNCGENRSPSAHSWNAGEVTATASCTTDGMKKYTCIVCGKTKTQIIPPTGHNYSEWMKIKAPSCLETGLNERVCSFCEEKETVTIPATGHINSEWKKDETNHWHVCEICNSIVDTSAHTYEGVICTVCEFALGTDGLRYTKNGSAYAVTGIGTATGSKIVISPKYNGFPVTSIGNDAFKGCSGLTNITIPNTVTRIGNQAFISCTGLTNVAIPNSVTSIGGQAFMNCSRLTKITIPNSVTSIGYQAFADCWDLTSITIPNSVTSIGVYAFQNTPWYSDQPSGLVYAGKVAYKYKGTMWDNAVITLKNDTVGIGDQAFVNCSGLTSITIPNSVMHIGSEAFEGCSGLTSITLPESVRYISSFAFSDCSGLTSVTIPNGVTTIGSRAFYNCSGLTNATIGDGVTSIGDQAFYNCSGLTSMTLPFVGADKDGTSNTHFGYIFGANDYSYNSSWVPTSLKTVVITGGSSIGNYAFYNCRGLTSVTIPDSVTSIGFSSFENCSGMTSIAIPNSVTSIGDHAFYNCGGLTGITIPNSVQSIGDYAFFSCNGLTSITIPNSVTSIGDSAFYNCRGLTSITIGNSVTSIGDSAFSICSGITEIYYTGDMAGWCGISFGDSDSIPFGYGAKLYIDNTPITDLIIPDSVERINLYAFNGYSGLSSIIVNSGNTKYHSAGNCIIETATKRLIVGCKTSVIPTDGSVTSIGDYAFYKCNGLTSITIPDSVTSIGNYAFYNCPGLTSVTIPDSVTSIGDYAFYYCRGLTNVTIGGSVTSIGESTFSNCSGLKNVTIGDSVTSIGSEAFYGTEWYNNQSDGLVYAGKVAYIYKGIMPSNTTITLKGDTTGIAGSAFRNCSKLTSITIPNSVKSIGDYAFSGCGGLTSITIPKGVTSVGSYAFEACSGLTSITIPDGVKSISSSVFRACIRLTSVIIPNSVESIDSYAFYGCSGLNNIEYSGTKAQWANLSKVSNWNYNTGEYTVKCSDGTLSKSVI